MKSFWNVKAAGCLAMAAWIAAVPAHVAATEMEMAATPWVLLAEARTDKLDEQVHVLKDRLRTAVQDKLKGEQQAPAASVSGGTCDNGVQPVLPTMGVVRMNLSWSKDWKAIVDNMVLANVKAVRFSLAPDFNRSFEIVKYARERGLDVLVAVVLAQPALYAKDVVPRSGGGHGIKDVRGLSGMDVGRYRDILTRFVANLDSSGTTISGIEVGNEINWADFNGDLPVLAKGRYFDTLDHPDLDKNRLLEGFGKYAEVVRITKEIMQHSTRNSKAQLVSAGLFSAWGPWFEKSGATALTVGLMNKLYADLGIDKLFDARAIHIYPQLSKDELREPIARQKIFADIKANAERCSVGGRPCLVTEWGFQSEFDGCAQIDPREHLFDDFVAGASCENRLRAVYLFDWDDGPRHKVWRCNKTTVGKDFFRGGGAARR